MDIKKIIIKIIGIVLIIVGYTILPIIWLTSSIGWRDLITSGFAYFVTFPLSLIGIVLLLMKKNKLLDIIVVVFGIVTLLAGIMLRITSGYPYQSKPDTWLMGYVGTLLIVLSFPYIIIGFLYLIKHFGEKSKQKELEEKLIEEKEERK